MVGNGSLDSMDKSVFNSSIEDNQSYDIYEAHNPNPNGFPNFTANGTQRTKTNPYASTPVNSFENAGYHNSTFTSRNNSNFQSRAESAQDTTPSEETPIIHSAETYPPSDYYNTDTLPLNHKHGISDSTLDLKRELERDNEYLYTPDSPKLNFLQELKSKMPPASYNTAENYPMKPTTFGQKYIDLPPKPPTPTPSYNESGLPDYYQDFNDKIENINFTPSPFGDTPSPFGDAVYSNNDRPKSSAALLETDLDSSILQPTRPSMPKNRSKSEALLETNLDYSPDGNGPITDSSRSHSQPLETAM